jgi:16S rRNA (cytosine967-C5)-methyltransferase
VRPVRGLTADELLSELQRDGVAATRAEFAPDAIRLPAGALGRLPPERLAMLRVQDEGSQLVARAAGARPGERVLDLAASPGGKTLLLSAALEDDARSFLVAADFRPGRVALLSGTLQREGLRVPILALDGRRPLPFRQTFDCVLIDAPCSGLGTLRRDPDLKWTRQPDDLARFAADQLRMVQAAADVVVPGGRVVYATCSSEPAENAGVVDAFLAGDPRYRQTPVDADLPPRDARDAAGALTTVPFRDGLDAFYAAVLVRSRAA